MNDQKENLDQDHKEMVLDLEIPGRPKSNNHFQSSGNGNISRHNGSMTNP